MSPSDATSTVPRRRPRKCRLCRKDGHNRTTCPNRTSVPSDDVLPNDVAMRTMIQPFYAIWLVAEGSVSEALANATRALGEARRTGLGTSAGDAMLQALAELELRARSLPPEDVVLVRHLKKKLDEAQVAYSRAAKKITRQLGYGEGAT